MVINAERPASEGAPGRRAAWLTHIRRRRASGQGSTAYVEAHEFVLPKLYSGQARLEAEELLGEAWARTLSSV